MSTPMNASREQNVPAFFLSLYWNSIISVVEEMGSILERTAYSNVVREALDFTTAIVDNKCRLVAQGAYTPGLLGCVPFAVEGALKRFPAETLRDGDAILLNEPQLNAGHYPDLVLISPLFSAGKIVAYVVNVAHHVDVGGFAPGSMAIQGVKEAYQEGLRIPPIRLIRQGVIDDEIMDLLVSNSRTPNLLKGDIQAQIASNNVGKRTLGKLVEEHGANVFYKIVDRMIELTETSIRDEVEKLPDGIYEFSDWYDDFGPGTDPIKVHVEITVKGRDLTVDFSKSGDQVEAAINCYMNFTRSYIIFAARVFTSSTLPQNHGVFNAIEMRARPGCFFNPTFPAPCGGRSIVQIRIVDAINGAFTKICPERGMGAFSHWSLPTFYGEDSTGKRFVGLDLISAGWGGRRGRDGLEGMVVSNTGSIPVEVFESSMPLLVRKLEFIPDTGGPGKFRGGCGVRKEFEVLTEEAGVALSGDRHKFAPFGVLGGRPGALGRSTLTRDGKCEELESKQVISLKKGDVVTLELSGGGGYGPPTERSEEMLQRDIFDGFTSARHAREVYGYGPKESTANILVESGVT